MLYSNSNKPYVAISYDSMTFNDLIYFSQTPIGRISPDEFLKNPSDENQYINLVNIELELRKQISNVLDNNSLQRFSYAHQTSLLSDACIGPGAFVYPGCILYPRTTLGSDVLLHANTMVCHGSTIDTGTVTAIGVTIAGSSTVGKFCFLGIKSTIVDKVTVCDNVILGANSLILQNINKPGKYVGSPCHLIK